MSATASGAPPHFLIFVPGIMGSQLYDRKAKKTVWLDFSSVPGNPFQWGDWVEQTLRTLHYPNDDL
ncbi:MAG TPA: hypothetical protein VFA26_21960, partial [Gemmataceae bacterium]|nr:hypothetical protein [Gemmataceae bacterium]